MEEGMQESHEEESQEESHFEDRRSVTARTAG
jgi:hypothetical protein